MKKFLLVSIMALGLGTMAMAKGHSENKMSADGKGHKSCEKMMMGQCQTKEEKALMREKMRTNPKIQEGRIKLQENKVAMMKEMAKENPNFVTVEKINKDRANIQAEMRTEQMKMKYELLKTNKTINQ